MKKIILCKSCLLLIVMLLLFTSVSEVHPQATQMQTYCNPINIDYTYMIYNAYNNISYRSGADPAVVEFRNEYYLFVTRSLGYWHSSDLLNWTFISPEKWYFEGSNAPAAFNYEDSVLYVTGNPSGSMSILYTDNPKKGDWKAVPAILNNLQDPCFFIDDDDKAYIYWGSSNIYPIRGRRLDKNQRFKPSDEIVDLFNLDSQLHGWERFGENHGDTILGGYIEGPWITKHDKTYYLQYAAPGTEFNVYGDGVYTANAPLGPYTYAPNNPVSYKPGGFMNGAGHGSTVLGPQETYWHFATMSLSYNINWERRIGLFPAYFDKDGLMHTNTYFGDYPYFAPSIPGKQGQFTGWMLLSYKKPVSASSQVEPNTSDKIVDENVKSFWLAAENSDRQWIEIDLENPGKVYAIQLNFHDHQSGLYGKIPGMYHRYVIEGSLNGTDWEVLVDRRDNYKDVPNDYVELGVPRTVRYVKYRNLHVPTPHLAVSALRVFGTGSGKKPAKVKNFSVHRYMDRRDAMIQWESQPNAQGYNVIWGIAPDKLYSSWLVYDENKLELKCLNVDQSYFVTVEAFNENGISKRVDILKME